MQPFRILDTPVTMRYIKYIVDISRISVMCMYVSLRLCELCMYVCVCATRGACLYLPVYARVYIYSLCIPSASSKLRLLRVALYQTPNFLGQSAISHPRHLCDPSQPSETTNRAIDDTQNSIRGRDHYSSVT